MHARSRAVRFIGIRKKRIGACAVILVLTLSSYERELNGPIGLRLALPYRTVRAFVFGARLVGTMDQDQDQGMRGGACSAMPAAASTLGSADSPPSLHRCAKPIIAYTPKLAPVRAYLNSH